MKALIMILISGCLLASCIDDDTINSEIANNISNRIKLKNQRVLLYRRYVIIEIDGIEYITAEHGGIIRITK